MNPRKAREVSASLERKGFQQFGGDHSFLVLYVGQAKTSIRTKISHGCTECSPNILSQMAKELHLNNKELGQLIDCPMTLDQLISVLKDRGHLTMVG
ncbi:MAG: hypothetical protein ACYC9Q_10260 [Bacillota bacterium]